MEQDEKQNYQEAYYSYCEGLQYFVPLIVCETDATKRNHLQNRATAYMERAEEIKRSILQARALQRQLSHGSNSSESGNATEESNGSSSSKPNAAVDGEEICIAKNISKVTLENKDSSNKPTSKSASKSNPVISAITPTSGFKQLRKLQPVDYKCIQ